MKITDTHLAVLMLLGIVMVEVGLFFLHWSLLLIVNGLIAFIVSMEVEPCEIETIGSTLAKGKVDD